VREREAPSPATHASLRATTQKTLHKAQKPAAENPGNDCAREVSATCKFSDPPTIDVATPDRRGKNPNARTLSRDFWQ
jgi:hypothetical protein